MAEAEDCLACELPMGSRGFKCNKCEVWIDRKCSPLLKAKVNEAMYNKIAKYQYNFVYKCAICTVDKEELTLDPAKCTVCDKTIEFNTAIKPVRKIFLCKKCKKWTHADCYTSLEDYNQLEARNKHKNLLCSTCYGVKQYTGK